MELSRKRSGVSYSQSYEFIYSKSDEPLDFDLLRSDLKSLVVIAQPIYFVPDLRRFNCLKDLWIVECLLHTADQIEHCKYLQNIHLSSNGLIAVPPVAHLKNLKVLWLPGNLIEKICDDQFPPSIEELNLADNRITTINNSFENCSNLETLNLSANPISSIFELYHLQKLRRLRFLWLCDPLYEMTSFTKLVNYRAFVVNCLPYLKYLDSHAVDERETELSTIYFINKQQHYKMLTMDAKFKHYINQEEETNRGYSELSKLKRNNYVLTLNEERAKGRGDQRSLIFCANARNYLNDCISDLEKKMLRIDDELDEHYQLKLKLIEFELKYFGNIKFKIHDKNSGLTRLCEKILNSFLCFHLGNINSVKVSLVTQVMKAGNVSLKLFSMLNDLTEQYNSIMTYILCEPLYVQDSYEPFLNYIEQSLFFQEVDELKYTVTQCLVKADSLLYPNNREENDLLKKRILSLVFIDTDTKNGTSKSPDLSYLINDSLHNKCHLFNAAYNLVTNPILLIEYNYILKNEDTNELTREEIQLLEREPYLPSQLARESLFCNPISWKRLIKIVIVKLNLTGFGMTEPFFNVEDLDVSYNKLTSLIEICNLFPNLITLNASFNEITATPTKSEMTHLKNLDLSWNLLRNLGVTLEWINNSVPKIKNLKLSFNRFRDINEKCHELQLVKIKLKNLATYNGIKLDDETYGKVYNVFTIENIFDLEVLRQSVDSQLPKYQEVFKLDPNEQCNGDISKSHAALEPQNNLITCLYIVNKRHFLYLKLNLPLSSLLSCTILRNKLCDTNFLTKLTNLRELNLSCNLLESIGESINDLQNIVKLNLSCNYIKSLKDLKVEKMPNLKFLDVSKNRLTNCIGIEGAKNMEELNISFNNISELDRFLFLKSLRKLRIIDIRSNGLEQMEILKRYLIYHVRTMEYINGSPMTEDEINEAQNAIGGVLDMDYIGTLYKNKDISKLKYLNLVNSSIRMVSLENNQLGNLVSVNLENNTLESISELLVLGNLKFLSLAGNHVSRFGDVNSDKIFDKLEELHLNRNGIVELEPLELFKMPKLKTLFLHDNQISSIKGIDQLSSLRQLILDRNKIASINTNDVKKFVSLKELYLESNHIHKLDFLPSIKKIIRLFMKNNRIENMETLKFLRSLTKMKELTFAGNPVCRRYDSYVKVLSYLPNLNYVDGFLIESFTSIESISSY